MDRHYLDWAATAIPYDDIAQKAAELSYKTFANPMSLHDEGKEASKILETSRAKIASILKCKTNNIYFTSGGSESDSIVLMSVLRRSLKRQSTSIVISSIEHSAIDKEASVLESFGIEVIRVKPNHEGFVEAETIANAIRQDTVLVSVMAVNNETGAIEPIKEIVKAIKEKTKDSKCPLIHCDAVQALAKIRFYPAELGLDAASFSGHKFGGQRACGVLYLNKEIEPLIVGGGQESGLRPGTHNTSGAFAFAEALERANKDFDKNFENAKKLEAILLDGIKSIPRLVVLPETRKQGDNRYCPYIVNLSFPGLGGETMVRIMNDNGFAISSGSACSTLKVERRVFDSMGIKKELSFASVRVSTGRDTTENDIKSFLETAKIVYEKYCV